MEVFLVEDREDTQVVDTKAIQVVDIGDILVVDIEGIPVVVMDVAAVVVVDTATLVAAAVVIMAEVVGVAHILARLWIHSLITNKAILSSFQESLNRLIVIGLSNANKSSSDVIFTLQFINVIFRLRECGYYVCLRGI